MEMKYIRYDAGIADAVVIFSNFLDHSQVALSLCPNRELLVSAGFVKFDYEGNLICFGKSHSLGLASDPKDVALIERQIFPEVS